MACLVGEVHYKGEWPEAVLRSLITLKALTFAPTGGIVAAPTTSLPECLGGVRNWDYRFCWVRDATLTLYALVNAGYLDEARAWREWLLRAVAGNPSELNILYGMRGERRLTELELPWLSGYEDSVPVRTGNAAYKQFQLDIFGEVANTLYECRREGLGPSKNASVGIGEAFWTFLRAHGNGRMKESGRCAAPAATSPIPKMMAWVAMDRAVKSMDQGWFAENCKKWEAFAMQFTNRSCRQGFDPELNSFVQFYGSKHLDASLLMLPLVGFLPADDPRMLGTVKAIEDRLMSPEGFVARYTTDPAVDGLPNGEGTFLPCTYWLADNYVFQGRDREARDIFERLLAIRNDVGLLSEEYDPVAKRLVGNFPQAFSHIGLVNTASNISRRSMQATAGRD